MIKIRVSKMPLFEHADLWGSYILKKYIFNIFTLINSVFVYNILILA